MAQPTFALDATIFSTDKVTFGGSVNPAAAEALLNNTKFPDGDIEVGSISLRADTGKVSLKPESLGGTSTSFEFSATAQSGVGVYTKSADALKALKLNDTPGLKISDTQGQRFLLMDWGYKASASASGSHPIGVLGSVSFGVDAGYGGLFAVLHRFGATDGANDVLKETIASWRLPRHVAYDTVTKTINLRPGTWLLAEADGSLALKLAASVGWDLNFAKDAKLLGVTHNLSVKIDAGIKATFGFDVSGKYVLCVAREENDSVARVQLFKQSSFGYNFGLDANVGFQGADNEMPSDFDGFIKGVFGVHGLQILNDMRGWVADPAGKLVGLAEKDAVEWLKDNGIDLPDDFATAMKKVDGLLAVWDQLPQKLPGMLWGVLGDANAEKQLEVFLADLADPTKGADALAQALQKATFGDSPEGKFLEAIAKNGLLALASDLGYVSAKAGQVLDILNGGIIAKLQEFINTKLDLDQIRKATDWNTVDQWLQKRLANFLDKTVFDSSDLKAIQKALTALDSKAEEYYLKGREALTKRYGLEFASTYQETTADTALIDVSFDLSQTPAAELYQQVIGRSGLDTLLTKETAGVTLNLAKLTHEIKRKGTVDLHMPLFDFSSTHINDALVTLTTLPAEGQVGRLLLYQIDAKDNVTVVNRSQSQLSILASLRMVDGNPELDPYGSIAYEMKQVKADMKATALEAQTSRFINTYLGRLFNDKNPLGTFYYDLDHIIDPKTGNQLGDVAISMEVAMNADMLTGWLKGRSPAQLKAAQMNLSRSLQRAWRKILPELYFRDLDRYTIGNNVAALLVWSSLRVTTDIDFDPSENRINKFDTDQHVFWDEIDPDKRAAMATCTDTATNLVSNLTEINRQLRLAGRDEDAKNFDPSTRQKWIGSVLHDDRLFSGLVSIESKLVYGAAKALSDASATMASLDTAPTRAIEVLAKFAGAITDTFNHEVGNSVFSGVSGRVVGPMLLVEACRALGSAAQTPKAMMNIYALKPGHKFELGDFIGGTTDNLGGVLPRKEEVLFAQPLVSLPEPT